MVIFHSYVSLPEGNTAESKPMPLHLVREPAMPWRQRTMHRPNEILMGQTQNMAKAEFVGNSWILMDYP